jgi:hypothetical protein
MPAPSSPLYPDGDMTLDLNALTVSSFATVDEPGDGVFLTNTDPRACPQTQGWNCTQDRTCPIPADTQDIGCDYTG